MKGKQKALQAKWTTYDRLVGGYNTVCGPDREKMARETLGSIQSMVISDPFWNVRLLTHSRENWAVEEQTQKGIQAYLSWSRCEEELRRISREVRQMVQAALQMDSKLQTLITLSNCGEHKCYCYSCFFMKCVEG